MNINKSIKKEGRRYNLLISLSLSLVVVILIISIVMVLFATQIAPVVFAQNRSNASTNNSILDEYTYVCIKFNETIGERGLPVHQNPDFLNTEEICNMLLQGMGSLDKQEILNKYE